MASRGIDDDAPHRLQGAYEHAVKNLGKPDDEADGSPPAPNVTGTALEQMINFDTDAFNPAALPRHWDGLLPLSAAL
ncbi:hypothetical protein [Streptomyces sp. NPDC087859]|uniref:hypothetical protein n=1 Tax=Streptomyces sp. NPDC087859 TaxID=3365812 RepID=UPI003801D288